MSVLQSPAPDDTGDHEKSAGLSPELGNVDLPRMTLMQHGRLRARKTLNRIDHEQVRRARGLLRALKRGQPDVVFLGDSMASFVGLQDTDRRRLRTMVADSLGSEHSIRFVDGPSFHADIFDAYLRLFEGTAHRPVVIIPLTIRVRFTPWIEHPVHGHKSAMARIGRIDPTKASWRVRSMYTAPTQADFDAFYQTPYATLLGDGVVADYVNKIAEYARTGEHDARVRMLYAYHHGGMLTADDPALEAVTRMGRRVKDLGLRAVIYETPVPIEKGSELLGDELAERTAQSFAVIDEAYRKGAGMDARIIQTGTIFSKGEFIDPDDATEHLNEFGRRRLTELIMAEVKALL